MGDTPTLDLLSSRRQTAVFRARSAVEHLRTLGVEAKIVGSLAKGTFAQDSDVDFLVIVCPRGLKYAIEGSVEDRMEDISFDLIYLDEIPASKVATIIGDAVDASRLS